MKEILLKILIICYGATAIVDTVAYWPTIKDLWHKKPSANFHSYILWTATTGIAFLYSLVVLPDLPFQIVSGMIFFANMLILFLSFKLKKDR
ncbi:MAG: hypothetical protein M0P97_03835 [Candidatus Moranbacteria bacterium]|jgi:hypothetical protein|nr:hypothetical protein [Candidatus Moranbacteria bacterium]